MSLAGEDVLDLGEEHSIVPEGGEGTPPYGQYPTETRFRRPDYKFFKTLDDSKEFFQRVQPLPPPPPPPQQQDSQQPQRHQQQQQSRSPSRRPVTAYARWPPRNRHQQQAPPPPREPEPGWRPIYPEPDLSIPRPSRPVTAPSTRSSAAREALATLQAEQQEEEKQSPPVVDMAAATMAEQLAPQPQQCRPAPVQARATPTPLAVVDFLEACPTNRQPLPPPPPQPSSAPAARFYRPKTAPGRVATAESASLGGGLQIQGQRLLPAERATSAKSSGPSVGGGVRQMSQAYDRALAVHGWRMEVPGDPFGIKHHLIPERKSVSVTVPEPTVKPLPPQVRRTNRFTFFHTTAPRVVMSFDIHPNFTSEQVTKARAALMKQGKWDYRYRDFSFMY